MEFDHWSRIDEPFHVAGWFWSIDSEWTKTSLAQLFRSEIQSDSQRNLEIQRLPGIPAETALNPGVGYWAADDA